MGVERIGMRVLFNRPWKIALLSLGGLLVLLLLVRLVLTPAAHPSVERELARIRAKGEPISRRGLDPRPGPNDEKASALLEQSFDGQPYELSVGVSDHGLDLDEERAQWLDCLEGPFEPNREKAEHALAAGADALALAEEALELLPFHYGRLPSCSPRPGSSSRFRRSCERILARAKRRPTAWTRCSGRCESS